jgi:hypothetical protein
MNQISTQLTKVTCRRCNGSGRYSFHIAKGTVCFGCNGLGSQMVDLKKELSQKKASEKRRLAKQEKRELVMAATTAVLKELNQVFNDVFDIETQLGIDQLNKAVGEKFGKSIWLIRDERLAV